MNILKQILIRAVPVAVMAFVIIAAIAYQRGVYDFTFIERPATAETLVDTLPPVTTTVVSTTPETTEPPVVTTAPDTAPPVDERTDIEKFTAPIYSTKTLIDSGYVITDGVWSSGFGIGIADMSAAAAEYSLRTRLIEEPVRVPTGEYSGYATEMRKVVQDRPVLEVYMDYLIYDKGGRVDILNPDGTILAADFDIDTYRPIYSRDKSDRPLFIATTPSPYNSRYTVTQYYHLDSSGNPKVNYYNDISDGRGLYINYPSYYGKTDSAAYIRYYDSETKLYGYVRSNGEASTEIKFTQAFNFSEGLAAVEYDNGYMYFIDRGMYERVISGTIYSHSYRNSSDRRVYDQYVMPDTFGIESLGFFYFDHGLVRARRQIIDAPHYEMYEWREIASDEDILLRSDGTEFPVPTDYTVVAYSNGMILLEKEGLYGFMDYTGKWVVQPIYTEAEPFNEGLATVGRDGKVGVIDTSGEFIIPMIFDHIGGISGGIIPAWDESCGWIVFNKVVYTG